MEKLTSEQAAAVLEQLKKATGRDAFELKPVKGETSLTSSKIGGLPYWPHEMEIPSPDVEDKDAEFALLAQLNLADFGGDTRLPSEGLLQFFVATDDLCGLDFDSPDSQKGFRVVYHVDVDVSITEEDVAAMGWKNGVDDEFFPIEEKRPLQVRKKTAYITTSDYRFESEFAKACQAVLGEMPGEDEGWWDLLDDEDADKLWTELGSSHLVFGWPFFTQIDPREYNEALRVYDELLLQLDTEFDEKDVILWGDSGVGNFFISSEALAKGDFSKVMFNWDCY